MPTELLMFDESDEWTPTQAALLDQILFRSRVRTIRRLALQQAQEKVFGGAVTAVNTPVSKTGDSGSNPDAPANNERS